MVAYATQAAIVALQTRINSPFYITSAYSYPSYVTHTGADPSTQYGKIISILSFLYQAANILLNASIVGAIWINANHLQNNGTGIREPGILSWFYNLFWIIAILGLGFASWAVGLARRGSGNTALAYPSLISADYIVRTIYVAYVAVIIAASTSATLEAFLCWIGIKKNGIIGVRNLICPHPSNQQQTTNPSSRTAPNQHSPASSCSSPPSSGPATPSTSPKSS
jgi:hypothetical protein